jgi:hypothetical protein
MKYLLLVPAGLLLATGIVLMYYSFGWDGGPLNQDIGGVGFSGLDNLALQWGSSFSFGLVAAGLLAMVWLNANAWKHTDGY